MTDRQTLDVYAERTADYANNFASDGPDRHLREFIALVPAGGKVLDLGCGLRMAGEFAPREMTSRSRFGRVPRPI